MTEDLPKLIQYPHVMPFPGKLIGIDEKTDLDIFSVNRIYWIKYGAAKPTQSEHAHKSLKQVIIALDGEISIALSSRNGQTFNFTLNDPTQGLYIPPLYWKKIAYQQPCILLCLASEAFNEQDYIRDIQAFQNYPG